MKLEGNEIISIDDYDVLFHILTAGNVQLRGLMLSFKVLLMIMTVKRKML